MSSDQSFPALSRQFEVGDLIDHGGDASVYHAYDKSRDQWGALKLFDQRVERDLAFVANFRREARQACDLDDPHVVRTLDYGYEDDYYYLLTEYVDAGNLAHRTSPTSGRVSPQLLGVFLDVCRALTYLHGRGLVHRRVKPTNILLRHSGEALLAGTQPLHELTTSGLTMTMAEIGSITYSSPEQIVGKELTAASDIYSLGVVMYEACTGRLPFTATNPITLAMQHLRDEPPLPRELNPALPTTLQSIILRCLAKEPQERFATAQELGNALQDLMWEETTQAVPIGVPAQTGRWAASWRKLPGRQIWRAAWRRLSAPWHRQAGQRGLGTSHRIGRPPGL